MLYLQVVFFRICFGNKFHNEVSELYNMQVKYLKKNEFSIKYFKREL